MGYSNSIEQPYGTCEPSREICGMKRRNTTHTPDPPLRATNPLLLGYYAGTPDGTQREQFHG